MDGYGDPVAQAYVGTIGVDYNSSTSTVTNSAGEYCMEVKRDAVGQLKAWRNEGGVLWSADATGLQTGSSPADCGIGGCVDLGDLLLSESGLAPDCP